LAETPVVRRDSPSALDKLAFRRGRRYGKAGFWRVLGALIVLPVARGADAEPFSARSRDHIDITTTRRTFEACPVANIKSQIKRNRQNDDAHERNKAVKSALKTAIRRFRETAESGDPEEARGLAAAASRKLDQAVSAGVIHKNQASNKKSAMAKKAASL
jgi:small subunit ribosomal protein S20